MLPRRAELLLFYLSLTIFWGSTFFWVKIATTRTSPFVVADVRLAVGALTVIIAMSLLNADKRTALRFEVLRPWLLRGTILAILACAVPFVLLAFAERHITSGAASILNSTAPLWAAFIAIIGLGGTADYRLPAPALAGLGLGLVGVAALVGQAPTSAEVGGQLLMLLLAAIYGAGGVYAQRKFADAPPHAAALLVTGIGSIVLLPLGIAGWLREPPDLLALGALLALGVTSTGLGYMVYFKLVRELGATRTLTVTYLQPLVALTLGILALGESVSPPQVGGLILILVGVAVANGQLSAVLGRAGDKQKQNGIR